VTVVESLIALSREAVLLALALAAPALLGALVAGIVTGLLGAVTQVNDPSVGMVVRVAGVAAALAIAAPVIARQLGAFAQHALAAIPSLGAMS
jgi:flagellar biosynthetic protein FliQ